MLSFVTSRHPFGGNVFYHVFSLRRHSFSRVTFFPLSTVATHSWVPLFPRIFATSPLALSSNAFLHQQSPPIRGNAILKRISLVATRFVEYRFSFVNGRHPFVGTAIYHHVFTLRRHSLCRVTLSFINSRHPFGVTLS
jgi:hypothetical protein